MPILITWIVGSLVLMAAVSLKVKPQYRASSYLRLEPHQADLYGVRGKDLSLEELLNTQVQLIESSNVLSAAAADPSAADLETIRMSGDVVMDLKKAIVVNVVPGTALIEVSMTSTTAREPAILVNAVVKAFMSINSQWADGVTERQILNLNNYLDGLRKQSAEVEKSWKAMVNQGEADPQVRERVADGAARGEDEAAVRNAVTLEMYREVQKNLFDVTLQLAEANALASALEIAQVNAEKNPASQPDEAKLLAEVELRLKADLEIARLSADLKEARDTREELRARSPAGDPAFLEASRKVEALLSLHDKVFAEKARAFRDESQEKQDRAREFREASSRVVALGAKQSALQQRFDQLEVTTRRQAADVVDLTLVREQRESLKTMQEAVLRQIEQLRFEQKGDGRITLIDQAQSPGRPISDDRKRYLAMTPVYMLPLSFALFATIEGLAGWSIRTGKEETPEEV